LLFFFAVLLPFVVNKDYQYTNYLSEVPPAVLVTERVMPQM